MRASLREYEYVIRWCMWTEGTHNMHTWFFIIIYLNVITFHLFTVVVTTLPSISIYWYPIILLEKRKKILCSMIISFTVRNTETHFLSQKGEVQLSERCYRRGERKKRIDSTGEHSLCTKIDFDSIYKCNDRLNMILAWKAKKKKKNTRN